MGNYGVHAALKHGGPQRQGQGEYQEQDGDNNYSDSNELHGVLFYSAEER
jgi:hypothetical protein